MATLTAYADTADGLLRSSDATYATAQGGAGFTLNTSSNLDCGQLLSGGVYYVWEDFIAFDTSSIDEAEVISSATLSLYGTSDSTTTDFVIEARLRDWGGTLQTSDWVAAADLDALPLLAHYDVSGGWSTTAYTDLESDDLAANIDTAGTTYILTHSDRLAAGTAPSAAEHLAIASANNAGTTKDPKLTVVSGVAAPVAVMHKAAQIATLWRPASWNGR